MISKAYISDNCDIYPNVINSLLKSYKNNCLSILCGAGISFCDPSRLPGGSDLINSLAEAMVRCVRKNNIHINYIRLSNILRNKALEVILDAFVRVFGLRALSYIVNLDISTWNPNHYYIANLAHCNDSFKIITLNFDILIETVLESLKSGYIVRCPLASDLKRNTGVAKTQVEIIKPHGSFSLPSERLFMPLEKRVENVTTTLQFIRDKPDPRTKQVFQTALAECTHLLVVGYRGEDWDIVPILDELKEKKSSLKITWVKYHKQENVEKFRKESAEITGLHLVKMQLSNITKRLLKKFDEESTIVFGDPFYLLRELYKHTFSLKYEDKFECTYETPWKKMNSDLFLENDSATILAIACLLEGTEEKKIKPILFHLEQSKRINGNLSWRQCYLNVAAWNAYTKHNHIEGIRKREEALQLNKKKLKKTDIELVEDLLGTGFQYLQCVKIRGVKWDWLVRAPLYLLKGHWYLRRVMKLNTSDFFKARAAYYKMNYRHGWALLLLLFGYNRIKNIRKAVFNKLNQQYEEISRKYGDHMDREYFYLRKIEAMFLSGIKLSCDELRQISDKIEYIEDYFLFTDEIVHLRNICIARAFLNFARTVSDKTLIKRYLLCALNNNDEILDGDIKIDRSVNRIREYLKNSSNETRITKSAIIRYTIFYRYFFPEEFSLGDVWHNLKQ